MADPRFATVALVASLLVAGCSGGLSDAEKGWCFSAHGQEIIATAKSLGVDSSKWRTMLQSELEKNADFVRVCKAAYAGR